MIARKPCLGQGMCLLPSITQGKANFCTSHINLSSQLCPVFTALLPTVLCLCVLFILFLLPMLVVFVAVVAVSASNDVLFIVS